MSNLNFEPVDENFWDDRTTDQYVPDPDVCQHRFDETTWHMTIVDGYTEFVCTQCGKQINPDALGDLHELLNTAEGLSFTVALRMEMDSGSYEEPPEPRTWWIEEPRHEQDVRDMHMTPEGPQ